MYLTRDSIVLYKGNKAKNLVVVSSEGTVPWLVVFKKDHFKVSFFKMFFGQYCPFHQSAALNPSGERGLSLTQSHCPNIPVAEGLWGGELSV